MENANGGLMDLTGKYRLEIEGYVRSYMRLQIDLVIRGSLEIDANETVTISHDELRQQILALEYDEMLPGENVLQVVYGAMLNDEYGNFPYWSKVIYGSSLDRNFGPVLRRLFQDYFMGAHSHRQVQSYIDNLVATIISSVKVQMSLERSLESANF